MITAILCCLFLNKNDRKLKHQQDIHSKKLFYLGFENSQTSHDPDLIIFNYSSHVLTESEKSLLCKGLNFAIPPKTLKYAEYFLIFQEMKLSSSSIKKFLIFSQKKSFLIFHETETPQKFFIFQEMKNQKNFCDFSRELQGSKKKKKKRKQICSEKNVLYFGKSNFLFPGLKNFLYSKRKPAKRETKDDC